MYVSNLTNNILIDNYIYELENMNQRVIICNIYGGTMN